MNWLVVLAIFGIVVLPRPLWQALSRRRGLWVLTAGAAVVGATAWLSHPEGLGAISTSLSFWFADWVDRDSPYTLGWFFIRIVTDEPLIFVFGLSGLWTLLRNQSMPGQEGLEYRIGWLLARPFLAGWLLWGLLLTLGPARSPQALAMVALPLLLLSAQVLASVFAVMQQGVAWRENGILTAILTILFFYVAFRLAEFSNSVSIEGAQLPILLLIMAIMLLLVVTYALWIDGRQARIVMVGTVTTLLLLWTLSSSWALNHHFDLRYPDGFFASYTNPDVTALVDNIKMLSAQRHGDATEIAIQVEMDETPDPVLGWYLRDMRNLTWVLAPGAVNGQNPPIVLTARDSSGVAGLSTAYLGSSYAIRDHWLPTDLIGTEITAPVNPEVGFIERTRERLNSLWNARVRTLLRWMIYHKSPTLPPTDQVVLWVATESTANQ
ncbi:MAG: hypothetical protein R2867_32120 [Caldilineaceae bacterium]